MPNPVRFSPEQLRTRRNAADISRTALAAAVGASYEALTFWETGKRSPRAEHLAALASSLDCAIDDLFTSDAPAEKEPGRRGRGIGTTASATQRQQENARGHA